MDSPSASGKPFALFLTVHRALGGSLVGLALLRRCLHLTAPKADVLQRLSLN